MSRSRYLLAVAASVWVALFGWSAHGWSALRASAPSASSPQTTRSTEPSPARDDTRATVDKYCVTCHNQRLRTGSLALDAAGPRQRGGARRRLGEGDSTSAGGHDAARGSASTGRGRAPGAGGVARIHAGPGRARQSEPGPPACASPESRRVCQCRSRSAGARR